MYKLRCSLVPIYEPIDAAHFLPEVILNERLVLPCPSCGIPSLLCQSQCSGSPAGPVLPVYQGMDQSRRRHPSRIQVTEPSLGQNRTEFREAEFPNHYKISHESSRVIPEDSSSGSYPGQARKGANDKTGVGKVWRTPSKNPLMARIESDRTSRTGKENPTTGNMPSSIEKTGRNENVVC